MNVLVFLIPVSLLLGGVGLLGFIWLLRHDQFDDPAGDANRVLSDRFDKHPAPPPQEPDEARRNPLDAPDDRP